jgi:hypothetical protein
MSDNLQKCIRDLEFVSKISCVRTQRAVLRYLSKNPKFCRAVKEIAVNVIKGNIDLNEQTLNKLRPHKKLLRKLISKKTNKTKRKELVIQSGGWFWLIPVITGIIDLLK